MSNETSGKVSRRQFLVGTGAAGAVALAGCTSDGNSSSGPSGNVRISGSSTVYPIATAVAELYKQNELENPDQVTFDISRDGSSGGFNDVFIPGDSDINNASRPITEDEAQQCEDNGFEAVEFLIAQDALTIVVNNNNDWIDGLTYDQLEAIWTPDNPPELWSDVNSDWPDEPFQLYGPASTSGTFDYFTETILGETGRIRSDFEGTEEDDTIASGVEGSEYAMGYLPFAYYTNNPDGTQAVPLSESGNDYTEPSLDAASSGEYPLARPLFFYANSNKLEQKDHLQDFIRYYINKSTDKSLIAEEIGYVQSSEQQKEENISTLEEYTG
ncbi:PstS family phosphate ABC transporter substrate-binding protein [Salinibaculum rarum]|uniref:PstS family phosphate ABC transporter substrate-binding protein n=1 Tax=Salinibaculum rarum TaxID=3058903 RepID=UPI00265EDF4F|nr:PstS family phosphate ABC transporter substrate-binding protein [Salinibaculum sp. KK48]